MAERNSSKQVNGVFIGLTTMDSVYYISDYPENNTKAKTNHYRCQVGGPAANAASTVSKGYIFRYRRIRIFAFLT